MEQAVEGLREIVNAEWLWVLPTYNTYEDNVYNDFIFQRLGILNM